MIPNHALDVGQILPEFCLPAVIPDGVSTRQSTLSREDFAGRALVLFVYPKDATSGCTIEVCGFRDLHAEFAQIGVSILGLSRDSIGAHKRFIENQNLPFALLSDRNQTLLRNWNLIKGATMYGKPVTKVRRVTFLVDGSGMVRRLWDEVTPLGHASEVLEAARSLSPS